MSTQTTTFTIPDMHCESCPKVIKISLEELPGISAVNADLATKNVTVIYDPSKVTTAQMSTVIKENGYTPQTS